MSVQKEGDEIEKRGEGEGEQKGGSLERQEEKEEEEEEEGKGECRNYCQEQPPTTTLVA